MTDETQQRIVDPLYEREDDAVPGAFYVVKDECIICNLPPSLSPRCIKMKDAQCYGDKYCHVYKQPETNQELDTIIEAMAGSCVAAIRYCGADPVILKRLISLGMAELCDATDKAKRNNIG